MKRIHAEIENSNIYQLTPKLFNVKSHGQLYQVWLGSDTQLPTCQCIDYRTKKLPCKHICAVVQQPTVGWESLGTRFGTHPLFTLDNEVIRSPQLEESKLPSEFLDSTYCPSISNNVENITLAEENSLGESNPVTVGLPCRKKFNIRKQCIQEVKSLHDELYVITDKDDLNETLKKIREASVMPGNIVPKRIESCLKIIPCHQRKVERNKRE